MDIDSAMTYLEFVEERHQIWEKRQAGAPGPWTEDPILASRKFTNVFRILDPGSQFILTDLVDDELEERDMLMRLFLYRHTGRTEVWEYLHLMLGHYPDVEELDDVLDIWKGYRGESGRPVFTNAYLVFPQTAVKGSDKLESIIRLTQRLFTPGNPDDVVPDFLAAAYDPMNQFAALRRNKGVADFMSMQILTDWHYTPHSGEDFEDRYVVLGPGAKKGAAAIAPSWGGSQVHGWAVDAIRRSPTHPQLRLPDGSWRSPSWMDVQNTLCEYSKYHRYASKPVAAKPYQPAHPGQQLAPRLPLHWTSR